MKRRNAVPAIPPYIDQWGRPTYENPRGQNRPNPQLGAMAQPAVNAQPEPQPDTQRPVRVPRRERATRTRRATLRRRWTRRTMVVAIALVSIGAATAVWAYFTATGSGAGSASIGTINAPDAPTLSSTGGTVHVSWTAPSGTPVGGYYVLRDGGAPSDTTSSGCGSAATPVPATTFACDDTGVANGSHSYTVTAVLASWTATSASNSITVSVDTTPPNAPVIVSPQTSGANSGTFSNGVFNGTTWGTGCTGPATICGTATDEVGGSGVNKTQLEVVGTSGANSGEYWNGTAFVSGTPSFFDTSGTTTWSYTLALPADGGYTLTAHTSDNSNNQSSDTTQSITVDTVNPTAVAPGATAAVTSGTSPTFVDNESVNLTDVPTDTGGSGVHSVAYFFCSGSTGTCVSTTLWTSIGSTTTAAGNWPVTWTTPLPADGPYRIVAVSTDNAGNVSGSSAATQVSVDTTPPTISRPIVNGNA